MKTGFQWLGIFLVAACPLFACTQEAGEQLPAVKLETVAGCRIDQACVAGGEGVSVTIKFEAMPRALQPFPVSLELESAESAKDVFVTFSMQGMDMGPNRYRLVAENAGSWKGMVTLPICTSGRSDWIAAFELRFPERRVLVQVPFVLNK